jgi:hypothetical protein
MNAQQQPEFEGEIRYLHFFNHKRFLKDSTPTLRQFGNSSSYKYKKGSYNWTFNGADLVTEWSSNATGKIYDKYRNSDTIFSIRNVQGDSLLRYEIKKNVDTILGYPVDVIIVLTGKANQPGTQMLRRIYYSSQFPINPRHASHLKSYSNDKVFAMIKAVPLRIDMETQAWPVIVRYEATSIKRRTVADAEIDLPKGAIIK